ncbi:hypothetical protein PR002_g26382 [Phytophthora rubi]|uniref:Uncharacterized protein n=1 Tax=Phytophthora rubi TaxID=129364 RepID=A0A6A3HY58_9STRA|nr:hypothetical protein PR002_g26382 [Phytophthora rubi]
MAPLNETVCGSAHRHFAQQVAASWLLQPSTSSYTACCQSSACSRTASAVLPPQLLRPPRQQDRDGGNDRLQWSVAELVPRVLVDALPLTFAQRLGHASADCHGGEAATAKAKITPAARALILQQYGVYCVLMFGSTTTVASVINFAGTKPPPQFFIGINPFPERNSYAAVGHLRAVHDQREGLDAIYSL